MKTSTGLALAALAALACHATAMPYPNLQWDPDTAKDCVDWYDNYDNECKKVRDQFSITPEQFHKWNPSIGLDCSGWHSPQSYCIVTLERLESDPPPLRTVSLSLNGVFTTMTIGGPLSKTVLGTGTLATVTAATGSTSTTSVAETRSSSGARRNGVF